MAWSPGSMMLSTRAKPLLAVSRGVAPAPRLRRVLRTAMSAETETGAVTETATKKREVQPPPPPPPPPFPHAVQGVGRSE